MRFALECFEFSELWSGVRPTAHSNRSVKTKLAALGVIAVGWSRCAMQDVLGSIRTGGVQFPVGVDFGEGQSGDESPHSTVYQVHTDNKLCNCFARPLASAIGNR